MFKKEKDVRKLVLEQIGDVKKCLVLFESFMRAASVPDTAAETLEALCEGLDKAEDVADASLRAMINTLSGGAYLPATRESIIAVATSCDKIANKCEYIASLIVIFGFRIPAEFRADFEKIYAITTQQFDCLTEAIGLLFSKMNELQKDTSLLERIRILESEVDDLEMSISKKIFAMDTELAAKMQFFQLVQRICDISDVIEDIADKIQIMLIARKA